MTTTFEFMDSELNAATLRKIRLFARGRKVKVTIQVEGETTQSNVAPSDSDIAAKALESARRMLADAGKNRKALEAIERFYAGYAVDMSSYKFNREEANER